MPEVILSDYFCGDESEGFMVRRKTRRGYAQPPCRPKINLMVRHKYSRKDGAMRKRNRHVSVWMNEQEYRHLKRQAEIAGMGMDPFIRSLEKSH